LCPVTRRSLRHPPLGVRRGLLWSCGEPALAPDLHRCSVASAPASITLARTEEPLDGMNTAVSIDDLGDVPAEVSRAAELLLDRKATDIALLDLRSVSSATDYFLIATGRSDTHVSAIADHVIDEMKKDRVRPVGVEGLRGGRWVLIDYVDFVVHVFHPTAREFYQLERLWGDAPLRVLEPQQSA
jgi:ribosome-associated protein